MAAARFAFRPDAGLNTKAVISDNYQPPNLNSGVTAIGFGEQTGRIQDITFPHMPQVLVCLTKVVPNFNGRMPCS
jgi:hypothetical protein